MSIISFSIYARLTNLLHLSRILSLNLEKSKPFQERKKEEEKANRSSYLYLVLSLLNKYFPFYGRLLKVLFHLRFSVVEFISNDEYSTVVFKLYWMIQLPRCDILVEIVSSEDTKRFEVPIIRSYFCKVRGKTLFWK